MLQKNEAVGQKPMGGVCAGITEYVTMSHGLVSNFHGTTILGAHSAVPNVHGATKGGRDNSARGLHLLHMVTRADSAPS